jgi:hypothetical protein
MTAMKQGRLAEAGDATELVLHEVDSIALSRLIEEVRNVSDPDRSDMTAYNRTYHRHNR